MSSSAVPLTSAPAVNAFDVSLRGHLHPRSHPRLWRAVRARRRYRAPAVDPRHLAPKGRAAFGARVRRAIWAWWPWAALSLVLVVEHAWGWAAVAAVVTCFAWLATPRSRPPRLGLEHECPVESVEFVTSVAGVTGAPFVAGNTFEVLHNGDAFYPRMLADIHEARCSITIEAYIYWAGEIGTQFATALAERARDGVRVTILLDAVGSADIGDEILDILKGGGCQIAWYNPVRWRTIGAVNNRTHRKSLIIDGTVAYTGGAGIADHWRGQARGPGEWRDIQVRFAGPVVSGLQTGFAHNWQRTTGEVVTGGAYFPPPESRGPLALQVILSSPETGGSSVQTMYYLAIAGARRSIVIANPYFVPDDVALDLLLEAAQRGVRITVMVSGVRNDNWLARRNSVRLYGQLLAAGIEILEYNRSMLHHKVMVVDSCWMTVGTANFDARSFAHNEESNVTLVDRDEAAAFEARFTADRAACATVTASAWSRRGLGWRVQEAVASVFQEQV